MQRQFIFEDSDCGNQIQAVMRVSIAEAFHPTLEIPVILIVTE